MISLAKSWRIFTTHIRPRRLFREDPGVKAALWFGRNPDTHWKLHIFANLLCLFFAIILAPLHTLHSFIPLVPSKRSLKKMLKQMLWGIEWATTPDTVLFESPGSGRQKEIGVEVSLRGQYAVTGNKPRWLLEVNFRGTEIVSWKQVGYEWEKSQRRKGSPKKPQGSPEEQDLQWRIENNGYTAISYAMTSAEQLFFESGSQLDPQPEIEQGGQRKYSLRNRRHISWALLKEYAHARRTIHGEEDGIELIWLDEYCLSDLRIERNVTETKRQRDIEVGQLADIFRKARRVAVFCHVEDCHHTDMDCPWVNRLFTLGEILYTPEVLRMTRVADEITGTLVSRITTIPGQQFRSDMQACAEEDKMWHLYNIMQHATNSGAVTWQSAIHSLVVEAIHRDEAGGFDSHKYLGKALNGLLPRRSQLEDLKGVDGWVDLAWLLELNQGYYNAALLAAVCKLADNDDTKYRWWGKPIAPKEGSERLEALATAIPARYSTSDDGSGPEPILSIIGPKSVTLSHCPERDPTALFYHEDMKSLAWCTYIVSGLLFIIGVVFASGTATAGNGSTAVNGNTGNASAARAEDSTTGPGKENSTAGLVAGLVLIWVAAIYFNIFYLFAGTIYVKKDTWVIFEDRFLQGRDPAEWLKCQDPTYDDATEWGPRQLIPVWDSPYAAPSRGSSSSRPYAATIADLQTGVFTKVAITSKPNTMAVLAVHGIGITCILLDRGSDESNDKSPTAVKVGMANVPPFVLAQAEESGTIYVGQRTGKSAKAETFRKLAAEVVEGTVDGIVEMTVLLPF